MTASDVSWPLKILLAVDGSQDAEAAVNLLSRITWPAGTLIHVLTTTPEPGSWLDSLIDLQSEVGQKFARLYRQSWFGPKMLTGEAANRLYTNNVVVKTEVWQGSPTSVILERATKLAAHLIVVGAKGCNTSPHSSLGFTAARIVNNPNANYSVLVARPSAQMQPLNVMLVVNDLLETWQAVEFLCALSLSNWARVTLMYVAEEKVNIPASAAPLAGYALPGLEPWIKQQAETVVTRVLNRLHACGAQGWSYFCYGDLADEVLAAAQEQGADLIVIGATPETFSTQQLLAAAPCSVLIIRGNSSDEDGKSASTADLRSARVAFG